MIYRLRYCNKEGVEARVDIQKGLATPVIDVEGTERPFILSYNNDKGDKSGMFLSSSADIEIYETTDFNIDNLKTSNETELSVTHYIDNVISWQGFIIPDFFSIEVRNNPVITMTASDRLGTLKNVTLSDLPSMISLRELAILCLNKTGLELPLRTMADFDNGTGINDFFNSKILTQRLSDTKGRSISCYDILSSILTASNSFLVQRSGGWHIINKIQHEAGSGKLYTGATSFINWSDVIFNFSDISTGGRRTIVPVASTVGVFHEFGGGRLHPENFDFSKDAVGSTTVTGWTSVNGFSALIKNEEVKSYPGGQTEPDYGDATIKNYLLNVNANPGYALSDVNYDTSPYLISDPIPLSYSNTTSAKITVDVNATGRMNTNVEFMVMAVKGTTRKVMTTSGSFEPYQNTKYHQTIFLGFRDAELDDAVSEPKRLSANLEDDNLYGYNIFIRIYGSGLTAHTMINFINVQFESASEIPNGTIYKTEKGDNFTKAHDIDTSLFGDYLTTGLNGYFYKYPIDDTSSLYNSSNELTTKWTAYNDPEQLPLLQHITRQKSRLFSVAHDLLSAEIEVNNFDPLAIFVSCDKRYTVVSGRFNVLKSTLSVELEEVAFQNASVRDFIYSYFGEGESGIKSVGGIASGTGGGGGGSGGGMTADQVAILSEVQVLAHDHGNKEVLDQVTQDVVDNALREMVISTDTETELTDENYLSSLRVLKEILDNNEYLRTQFLSKVNPDTAQEIIKFVKGIEIGTFTTGPLGAGASLKMENGVSRMEVDQLDVRMRATFRELIIESLKHIGGQLILSPARMKCTSVVDGGTYYRCYFDTGDGKVSNEFVAGDQARCQVFTGSGVKMYWRLVTSVGADWINLSKTDAISGSSIPEAGDDIVQLGHRTDTTRQNAQILSTVGADAPSWKQYKGINAFSLEGKDTTVFSGTGNKIDGKTVFMSSGANVEDGINSKNSNYSSQPTSYKANDTWTLSADTTVNGIAYKSGEILTATQDSTTYNQAHWVKKVRYTDDTAVNNLKIGGVNLIDGTSDEWKSMSRPSSSYYSDVFYPNTELVAGQTYTFSWEAELVSGANNMYINIGAGSTTFERNIVGALDSTTHAFNRRSITFTPTEYQLALGNRFAFRWYNNLQDVSFRYRKLKLEIGSKVTDWDLSKRDRQSKIDSAKQEALTAAGNAQTSANTANTAVGNLNTYVDGSFKDGVIEASEAKAIEKYINVVNTEKSNLEATYNTLYTNTYLEGTPKTNLLNAKVTYFGAVDTLINSINTAITDGRTTVAEKQAVDTNYSSYKTALASLQTSIENANKAIQAKLDALSTDKVNNLQIGGSNLINDYKFSEVTATSYPWWLVFGTTIIITGGRRLNANSKMATKKTISAKGGDRFIVQVVVLAGAGEIIFEWGNPGWQPAFFTAPLTVGLNVIKVTAPAGATYILPAIVTAGSSLDLEAIQVEAGDKPTTIRESEHDAQLRVLGAQIGGENISGSASGYSLGSGWTRSGETLSNVTTSTFNHCQSPNFNLKAGKKYIVSAYVNELSGTGILQLVDSGTNNSVKIISVERGLNIFEYTPTSDAQLHLRVYGNTSTNYVIKNIIVNAALTDRVEEVKLTAEQARFAADGYMRARYIRDWASGSSANLTNHWVEIKVLNKAGTNLASGKTATSNGSFGVDMPASNITDNNTSTFAYITNTVSTAQYAKIDLGQIYYDIDYIQVWHYYADGRTYYGTKTEISTDGVNWTPVFDSAKSGTYKETAAGNIISFRPNEVLAKVLKGAAITDTFKTTINGGLISTVITEYRELNSEQVTGLISGIQGADKDLPFLVAGGTYAEGIAGAAKAIIRHDGSGHLANGNIEWDDAGNVELSGKIASGGGISTIGDKIKLNSDGSGQLAGGNIEWDADGNVVTEALIKIPFEDGNYGYPTQIKRLRNYVFTYNNDYTVLYLPENSELNGVRVMFINWRTSTKTLRLDNTRFFGQWYSGDTKRFDIPVNGYCEMVGFSLGTTFQGWLITNSGTIL